MSISEYANLIPASFKADIAAWIKEDIPSFDYGGYVVGKTPEIAILYGKSPGVLAGIPFFNEVFNQLDCSVEWFLNEGDYFEPIKEIAKVQGNACNILIGERIALNIIARCSGIATREEREKRHQVIHNNNDDISLLSSVIMLYHAVLVSHTGFRLVEKYGMLVGGADTHRMNLSSMIMLKDNHIWSQGSITKAVERARNVGGFSLKIDVECRTEAEADEAIQAGADVIMLDNFNGENLSSCAKSLKQKWTNKKFLLESSGGITEENITEFFCPGMANFIG
ncbi:25322_t:CDS:2 [Gigaspora margarita]|uniref:Nicotinate-nucleotide pyrophosphorylase [carboxylating] n=1 Tax=Gigaspora margarita TaxID=4874 RepID=A0ABN7WF60_GIGMA|nr:25322_t:CDS:2 [Gigaspora margarita]